MKIKGIFILGLMTAMVAGSGCRESDGPDCKKESKYVDGIKVAISDMVLTETTRAGSNFDGQFDPQEYIPFTQKFDDQSIVFVSQMTNTIPAFQNEDVIYSYGYIPGSEGATWDDEYSYNFAPNDEKDPLEWFKIGAGETYHGGFSLYALYFPLSDQLNETIGSDNTIHYLVMQDQSTLENLQKSDILGAYHSTDKLFTRIRFKMFHLMTYLRVRLYVPVYRNDLHTGFRDNALQGAMLTNVTPEFAMQWTASISSDVQAPVVNALHGNGTIIMYKHPLPVGETSYPIETVNYRDLLGDGYFDQGLGTTDYDEVRVYEFSVIIPPQKGEIGENGEETTFTNTDFLHFYLYSNSGALKHYSFNQTQSANSTESNLVLNQGNFQLLNLYVPRVGDKAINIGAKVQPWNKRTSSFQLTQQPD